MSEYWVSHKKYFCKYCNIYIADDVPSRRQHESGLRHKGSVERFVRGLYKEGEKKKQDLEEEKREMARVEQAAQAAYARDVGAGLVKPGSGSSAPTPSTSSTSRKPDPKPSNPYANYSTAESLGYQDPDAERLKAETERRRTQGVAGEWEVVAIVEPAAEIKEEEPVPPLAEGDASRKRGAEQDDHEDSRTFKLRKKTVDVGLGEVYDPGLIPIKLKKEESVEPLPTLTEGGSSSHAGTSTPTAKPKWSARGWNRPGERNAGGDDQPGEDGVLAAEDSGVKFEAEVKEQLAISPDVPPADAKETSAILKTEDAEVKVEVNGGATVPSTGSLFRKRKVPAGGAGSRGRR
ncbi:hypothetical protein BKA93DRAFT_715591, partial [Sparassis latifolia]